MSLILLGVALWHFHASGWWWAGFWVLLFLDLMCCNCAETAK